MHTTKIFACWPYGLPAIRPTSARRTIPIFSHYKGNCCLNVNLHVVPKNIYLQHCSSSGIFRPRPTRSCALPSTRFPNENMIATITITIVHSLKPCDFLMPACIATWSQLAISRNDACIHTHMTIHVTMFVYCLLSCVKDSDMLSPMLNPTYDFQSASSNSDAMIASKEAVYTVVPDNQDEL